MPDLDLARLKGTKLFVGTPMYDGKCFSDFAFSIAQLTGLCAKLDIELHFLFVTHEALIDKARNITVDRFLKAGGDSLIFIDADIGFDPKDVLHCLALQRLDPEGRDFDVVAAPYPTKAFAWDTVLKAAKAGVADADPASLARYASPIALFPAHATTFAINAPIEVTQAGTGFMLIGRETFLRYRDHFPRRSYGPKTSGDEGDRPRMQAYFETEIDSKHEHIAREIRAFVADRPDASAADILAFVESEAAMAAYSGKHISEDYAFCRRVREAGMKVWLCPWMELTHTGSHRFTSRLADLGAIGAT